MLLKFIIFLFLICNLQIVISQLINSTLGSNHYDNCQFKSITNDFTRKISVRDIFIEELERPYLGRFLCITINNTNFDYNKLTIKFNGATLNRNISSNVRRQSPTSDNDTEEQFSINNRPLVKIFYSPFSTSTSSNLQQLTSIKLNRVEVFFRELPNTNLPSIPNPYDNPFPNYGRYPFDDRYHQVLTPDQMEEIELRKKVEKTCRDSFEQREKMECEAGDTFFVKRLFLNNKTLWCIFQSNDLKKAQFDFTFSNSNYELYQTSNEIFSKTNNNLYKLNEFGLGGHRYPTIFGAFQSDINKEPPSLEEVRFRYKKICDTPLLGRPYDCGHRSTVPSYFDEHVQQGEYPWQVNIYEFIQSKWYYKCGGTIMNPTTILTAAQCVNDLAILKSPQLFRVHFNEVGQAKTFGTSNSERTVTEIISHEKFLPQYHEYDLALLKLNSPIDTLYYNPTCLTNNHLFLDNRTCLISGFGIDLYDDKYDTLKQADIIKVKNDDCRRRNNVFRTYLTETTFCGEFKPEATICPENPGSALYCLAGDKWYLHGMVAMGVGASGRCSVSEFILLTDITETYDWVANKLK